MVTLQDWRRGCQDYQFIAGDLPRSWTNDGQKFSDSTCSKNEQAARYGLVSIQEQQG